jgi:Secretion system C-terminal sorting domain
MKLLFPIILLSLITFSTSTKAQVSIDTISLVSNEAINTQFCFNNTKLMDGNNNTDRYIVYYNPDSIFLNVNQSKSWTRKTVYTGSNISSATLAYTLNRFGSAYPGFNKIDENNFYLAWLTKDTISNKMKVFERLIHYSIPTAINWADQNQQSKIAIFPNPFFTNTTIKTDKYLQKASLIIFNLKGQKVKEIKNFSGFTYILYRENLPAGMYIMQILQDNKVIVTEKILVS